MKVMDFLRSFVSREVAPKRGLLPAECAMVAYLVVTSGLLFYFWTDLPNATSMLGQRVGILVVTFLLWALYRAFPIRLLEVLRVLWQLLLLNYWYPEIFEFNRLRDNCDCIVAGWEQSLFGGQPSLWFSEAFSSPVFSEFMNLGYFSYYPMIVSVVFFYFFARGAQFHKALFTVIGGFFVYYVVFDLFPVAGPQFYFHTIGVDAAARGEFAPLYDFYAQHFLEENVLDFMLPAPGWSEGIFRQQVINAQIAGEHPMAAFPSSHCGVSTLLMCLAWKSRSRKLMTILLPFYVLLVFSTVYIQAHYAVDAIAGVVSGVLVWWGVSKVYDWWFVEE